MLIENYSCGFAVAFLSGSMGRMRCAIWWRIDMIVCRMRVFSCGELRCEMCYNDDVCKTERTIDCSSEGILWEERVGDES